MCFGLAHLLMNGWLGDIIFFGGFVVLGIVGGIHQDRRKLREIGAPYREFLAATSFFPGGALIGRRVEWSSGDIPWTAVIVGIAGGILLVTFHPLMFGGSPVRLGSALELDQEDGTEDRAGGITATVSTPALACTDF